MRLLGKEMISLGMGLPVLYLAFAVVAFHDFTASGMLVAGSLSFLLITLGREVLVGATGPQRESAHEPRLVRDNPRSDRIDHDSNPSDFGSPKRLEPRKGLVRSA
jgi:hypothetical protein